VVDWVDDWFVDFSMDMISDVEGSLQPLPNPTPSGSVFEFFTNLINGFVQFMGLFFHNIHIHTIASNHNIILRGII